jgi:hypothetical protein
MLNPEFWRTFLPLFYDEATVREFATITGLSDGRIRRARADNLRKISPHLHEGNDTIN